MKILILLATSSLLTMCAVTYDPVTKQTSVSTTLTPEQFSELISGRGPAWKEKEIEGYRK